MKKSPLAIIHDWLLNLPLEIREELIDLGGHFHEDDSIYKAPRATQSTLFLEYLTPTNLVDRETVRRTFHVKALIDFALDGRDTEEGWLETFDRHLGMRQIAIEKNESTEIHDKFLNEYENRKNRWLQVGNEWHALTLSQISNRSIADWYFSEMLEKRSI